MSAQMQICMFSQILNKEFSALFAAAAMDMAGTGVRFEKEGSEEPCQVDK